MTRRPRRRYVEVIWDDATSTAEWTERDNLPQVPRFRTRGWVVLSDKKRIVIAATEQVAHGDSIGEVASIQRGMIHKIIDLGKLYPELTKPWRRPRT